MSPQDKLPPIVLKSLGEYKPGESWSLLYYGPSKAGKTWFAGTTGPRTLFIDIGDGLETLLSPKFLALYPDTQKMIIAKIEETSEQKAFDQVNRTIDYALDTRNDDFDTVVLDEATAFRRHAINKAIDLVNIQRTKFRASRTKEFVKADVQDFGVEMEMIEWFLGEYSGILKKAKKNFLVLAHQREIYGKPEKIGDEAPLKRILPGFTGQKFPDKVPAYFDDVWKAERVGTGSGVVYRALTEASDKLLVGSRHAGIFAPKEENPNFLKMLQRIKNRSLYIPKPTKPEEKK
jgi:AAA domain-containing protein